MRNSIFRYGNRSPSTTTAQQQQQHHQLRHRHRQLQRIAHQQQHKVTAVATLYCYWQWPNILFFTPIFQSTLPHEPLTASLHNCNRFSSTFHVDMAAAAANRIRSTPRICPLHCPRYFAAPMRAHAPLGPACVQPPGQGWGALVRKVGGGLCPTARRNPFTSGISVVAAVPAM